ncbi:MAG: winged helix-turn-helix domain-containing protein [Pseudomonadota bacterium]
MKIHIKTRGELLYSALHKVLQPESSWGMTMRGSRETQWQLSKLPQEFDMTDWVCQQNTPTLIMIDAEDVALLRALQASQSALQHLIGMARHPMLIRCPVILVFNNVSALSQSQHLPEFTTDWILGTSLATEAIPRITGALKKSQVTPAVQHHAALTLIPATRTMIYENTSARLTPAEYTLLELFLNNIGSIISLQELVQTFRASGKSAEANNIRVAIYQLRLKLDTLTKSQMPLTSIYRQGYCLRQKLKSKTMHVPMATSGNRYDMQSPV